MKTFVCIMHYETIHLTDSVLSQLEGLSEDIDVFVNDDGSVKPYDNEDVFTIRCNQNLGYVRTVNNAINIIAGIGFTESYDPSEVAIWTLNTDVKKLSPEILKALTDKLSEDRNLAAISPAICASPHSVMHPGPEKFRFVKYIDWVAPLVRLSAWQALSGFDTNLKGFGCDIDFCKRARDKKWKFGVLPKYAIEHEMGGTTKTLVDDKGHSDLEYMNRYLCQKHGVNQWTDLKTKG